MSTLAIRRHRAVTRSRELLSAALRTDFTGMSRKDAARWASAQDMADLGELVVAWLNGELTQTPGHCGPPCAETVPLTSVLPAVNRAGFVTDNSQRAGSRAGRTWNTWVTGFAGDATLSRLRTAVSGTPLDLDACRGRTHGCGGKPWGLPRCPRKEATGFWEDACPHAAGELHGTWWVYIEDPEPGRNDVLWPVLAAFAAAMEAVA